MKTTLRNFALILAYCTSFQLLDAQVTVYSNQAAFITATSANPVPFPTVDEASLAIALSGLTIEAPNAIPTNALGFTNWNIYADALPINTSATVPSPNGTVILGNGEDDYDITFTSPVNSFGVELITNSTANETVTLYDASNNVIYTANSPTASGPNQFAFMGFESTTPIARAFIETVNGHVQNEVISGLWMGASSSAVPTVSQWGLIILGLLTLCIGAVAIRRRSVAVKAA